MTKYVRLVLEREVEEDSTEEEKVNQIEDALGVFIEDHWGIDDLEISDTPYQPEIRLKENIIEWLGNYEGCVLTSQFMDDAYNHIMALEKERKKNE